MNTQINFTELEQTLLDAFIPMLYAEVGFTDVDVDDLSHATKISTKILRGVIASLVTKGVLYTDDNGEYVFINLHEDFYYMHPEWSKESN